MSTCLHCDSNIFSKYAKKFCCRSCAASYNNKLRKPRTEESKQKTRLTLLQLTLQKPLYTKIKQCVICSKYHPRSGKTCSAECQHKLQSKAQSESLSKRDRRNYGRGKLSYMEKSFKDWLDSYNIYYLFEPAFKNFEANKTYFPDFYFPQHKLIIELDGTQHIRTKEKDEIRDNYIFNTYKITVMRITHKEYINQSKIEIVKSLLNIK